MSLPKRIGEKRRWRNPTVDFWEENRGQSGLIDLASGRKILASRGFRTLKLAHRLRKFLGLTLLDTPSSDHSTFSRFRKRVSKNAMIELNSLVLNEFAKRGLVINEGIAVDARLVKSASKPLSNTEIEALRQKRNSPGGKLDKNGNPLKFCRDAESNWVIKNKKHHYGLKEHASVDVDNGFILATTLTPASESDSVYLPYLTIASCHTKDPIEKVCADKDIMERLTVVSSI